MNKFREMLATKIESNGGYSAHYESYAIEYTVGLYYAHLDKDHIYEKACKEFGYIPPLTGLEWDEGKQWEWGQSDMYETLNDDCSNTTYSPTTAIKYGLPYHRFPKKYVRKTNEGVYYPAKKDGWILKDPFECVHFEVEFGLAGRGGKHLVVKEFEGHSLKELSSEDLAEKIRSQDYYDRGTYSNKWCLNLLAMMEEWETSFTSKNASAELEYLAAGRMYSEQYDLSRSWRKHLDERRSQWNAGKVIQRQAYLLANPMLPGFEVRA